MLFADNAVLSTHTKHNFQQKITSFLTYKRKNVMSGDVSVSPSISLDDVVFEVIDHFIYLDSNITNRLLLDKKTEKKKHQQKR